MLDAINVKDNEEKNTHPASVLQRAMIENVLKYIPKNANWEQSANFIIKESVPLAMLLR